MSPTSRLAAAIKQTKPFRGPEHEVFLGIQRAASELTQGVAELLKPTGVTGAQYNVLRILRGVGKEGLSCGEVSERLLTRDPDMTRLLDRMERRGLISRARDDKDRRLVLTRLTGEGLELVGRLDEPVQAIHHDQMAARQKESGGNSVASERSAGAKRRRVGFPQNGFAQRLEYPTKK